MAAPLFAQAPPGVSKPQRIEGAPHLPNAFRLHEKVVSGGLPEGETGFAELAALGIKTIISVDGAKPDVELARKLGLRYVHLPHGYDGISDERALDLAQAVRELPGPIYIHCHHGKHRSPAAATVACITAGLLPPAGAEEILKAAGTNPQYRGLYQSVQAALPISAESLSERAVDFPEIATLPPLAQAMVEIESRFDRLKKLEASERNWSAATDGLPPASEALLLEELYKELLRQEDIRQKPAAFQQHLHEGQQLAGELRLALEKGAEKDAAALVRRLETNCTACHRTYRDQPSKP